MTGHLSAQVIWSEETEEEETKRAGALSTPQCSVRPHPFPESFQPLFDGLVFGVAATSFFAKRPKRVQVHLCPTPISSLLVQFWR